MIDAIINGDTCNADSDKDVINKNENNIDNKLTLEIKIIMEMKVIVVIIINILKMLIIF